MWYGIASKEHLIGNIPVYNGSHKSDFQHWGKDMTKCAHMTGMSCSDLVLLQDH